MAGTAWSGDSSFKLADSGDTLRDITANITRLDGLPGTRETRDGTGLGQSGRLPQATIESGDVTIEGFWDSTVSTGSHSVLKDLFAEASPAVHAYEYGPEGVAVSDIKITGNLLLRDYVILAQVGELITFRAVFEKSGVTTFGAF